MNTTTQSPLVWAVVLGWNHSEDTVACLQSLLASRNVRLKIVYVDNGSNPEELQSVMALVSDVAVIRHPNNVGVPRAFNSGLAYALKRDADYVFMANNDTIVDPDCLAKLVDAGTAHPEAGLLAPKIFYHREQDVIWSAGSRLRRFPPAIVMRQTTGADDGRYDDLGEIEFSSFCTVLLRASALKAAGLMDPNFVYYYEDYDLSLRVRLAGYTLRLVPQASSWHKVEKTTRAGKTNPSFWLNYGRSESIFCRKHSRFFWLTGPVHRWYLMLRAYHEGRKLGLENFRRGMAEGRALALRPVPAWMDTLSDSVEFIRS